MSEWQKWALRVAGLIVACFAFIGLVAAVAKWLNILTKWVES